MFPQLYLPVMTEANARVLRPHRKYLPTPEWFRFRSRMAQLNAYLISMFRRRWQARNDGTYKPLNGRKDILDRIMDAIAESGEPRKRGPSTCLHVYCSTSVQLPAVTAVLRPRMRHTLAISKPHLPFSLSSHGCGPLQPASVMCTCGGAARAQPSLRTGTCTRPLPSPPSPYAGTKWDTALETQLCYEVKTFLLAGHETSAAMLTWSTFELSKAPAARSQVGAAAAALCMQ